MSPELQALQDADFGWARFARQCLERRGGGPGPNQDLADGLITELAKLTKSPNPYAGVSRSAMSLRTKESFCASRSGTGAVKRSWSGFGLAPL